MLCIFKALIQYPGFEWEFIDGTVVKAHQHSAGAVGKIDQAIGHFVAGNSTKIHMATDAFGLPLAFILRGGGHECKVATPFIESLPVADYVIADKGLKELHFRLEWA